MYQQLISLISFAWSITNYFVQMDFWYRRCYLLLSAILLWFWLISARMERVVSTSNMPPNK